MRIELNSGGLASGAIIHECQSNFDSLVSGSRKMVAAFQTIKSFTSNINGGIGSLQEAVDRISSRAQHDDSKSGVLESVQRKANSFVELARRIDLDVGGQVNRNKNEFYNVNPWSRPPQPKAEGGLVNASSFKLSRKNYKFIGWSTDPTSKTIFDQNDATITTIDFFPDIVTTNGSVTFYARWEIDPPKNIDLRNGDQYELGITNDMLTFSSNEPKVAVISPSGVITALGPGEAIISILDEYNNAVQINIKVLPVMMIGDVDLDRELTIADAILLQKWLLTEPDTSLPDWVAGDMNGDGKLNAIDLTLLKRMLLK